MENSNIIYTIDYFIKKFEAIPAEKWCVKLYHQVDPENKENVLCCALGHCGVRTVDGWTREGQALWSLFVNEGQSITMINDSGSFIFHQKSPKERVMAALNWLKEKEVGQYNTKVDV